MEELAPASTKQKDLNALVERGLRAKIVKKSIFVFLILAKTVQRAQKDQEEDMNARVPLATKGLRVKKEAFVTQILVCMVVLALMKHTATDAAAESVTVALIANITFVSQTHATMVDLVSRKVLPTDASVKSVTMEIDVNW